MSFFKGQQSTGSEEMHIDIFTILKHLITRAASQYDKIRAILVIT